jgi:cation/acetate symporter
MSARPGADEGSAETTLSGLTGRPFARALGRYYAWFTFGFLVFVLLLGVGEWAGLPRVIIGYTFLFATIGLYAGIGIMSRTTDVAEYYVAGRSVPAFFNGMATGADWMSAASFIGLAGSLYVLGFDGLAFVLGWTGGYCLVALLIAPYLRKFGQFTLPDFIGARYGGDAARAIAMSAGIICSFVYVVAQIYGVGLITTYLTNVDFSYGVFLGLAGILVCSFLGGMRAVTWTQVAQCIILLLAYLIPVAWLGLHYAHTPLPQLSYGGVLERLGEREQQLAADPRELAVRQIYLARARADGERVAGLPGTWQQGERAARATVEDLKARRAPLPEVRAAEQSLAQYPASPEEARVRWQLEARQYAELGEPLMPHAEPYWSGDPDPVKAQAARSTKRLNFLALVFCLMAGTAALPHILMRSYTTPTVHQARRSIFWALFFILMLYLSAPTLAVLVKYALYTDVVGKPFNELPAWVGAWSRVDPDFLRIDDVNHDGILQLGEMQVGPDIVVLAMPEIAGLPYLVTGLVAAGGLAAALSTADGLLLTIANALSHDLYFKMINRKASPVRRVTMAKVLLLVVALVAAFVALLRPGSIVSLVGLAFSLAGASLFPPLVLGVFWRRANRWGAIAGMLTGFGLASYYIATRYPFFQAGLGLVPAHWAPWFGIEPISSGVFAIPVAFAVMVVVSLCTPKPSSETDALVDFVRMPAPPSGIEPGAAQTR